MVSNLTSQMQFTFLPQKICILTSLKTACTGTAKCNIVADYTTGIKECVPDFVR
jgi:hypothetical protein